MIASATTFLLVLAFAAIGAFYFERRQFCRAIFFGGAALIFFLAALLS
jgi:hypothetical protein